MKLNKLFEFNNKYNISSIVFSNDNKYLILGNCNQSICILDIQKKDIFSTIQIDFSNSALTLSPDGLLVCAGSNDYKDYGQLLFFDINKQKFVYKFELKEVTKDEELHINYLKFSPNGKFLAILNMDVIRFFDYSEKKEINRINLYSSSCELDFSMDSRYLAYASNSPTGISGVIDLNSFKNISLVEYLSCTSVAYNIKECSFNFVYEGGGTDNIDPDDKGKIISFKNIDNVFTQYESYSNSENLKKIVYSSDGSYMLSTSINSNELKIWDNKKKNLLAFFSDILEKSNFYQRFSSKQNNLDSLVVFSGDNSLCAYSVENKVYIFSFI